VGGGRNSPGHGILFSNCSLYNNLSTATISAITAASIAAAAPTLSAVAAARIFLPV